MRPRPGDIVSTFVKLLAGAVITVAVVMGAMEWRSRGAVSTPSDPDRIATVAVPDSSPSPAGDSLEVQSAQPSPGTPPGQHLLAMVGQDYRFDPANPDNAATSEADADWLRRSGFLDRQAERLMRDASMEDLEAAAETDLRAQVILAYRMAVIGGYGDRPFALLEDAAVRGSVFALMTWGDIHYTVDGYRNPALGAAYYRLAYRRGYFTAATANYTFASTLTNEMRLVADVFTEPAWSRLQALRAQKAMQPFREVELRPGFDAFLAQVEQGLRQQQQCQ